MVLSARKRASWRRGLTAYALLACASWVVLLFVNLDEPDPQPPRDLTVTTPYLEQVADALRSDGVYSDPSLPAVELPAAGELDGDPRVHVAHLAISRGDGSGGQAALTLARLQHLVGEDGIYVAIDQQGSCSAVAVSDGAVEDEYCGTLDSATLQQLREDFGGESAVGRVAATVFYPVVVGTGLCILLHYGLHAIGWLRRRRVRFLPGVR